MNMNLNRASQFSSFSSSHHYPNLLLSDPICSSPQTLQISSSPFPYKSKHILKLSPLFKTLLLKPNVSLQTPKEELGKLVRCIEWANAHLVSVVKLLAKKEIGEGVFKREAKELLRNISKDVRKAYCNCLIDLCVNLNLLENACELSELGLKLEIYKNVQLQSPKKWSLHLKSLSLGAALTGLHIWMNDLLKAVENGEELPPLLGIHTDHGKHKYLEHGLAALFEAHLRELNAHFMWNRV